MYQYRTSEQQMNDALAFGICLMFTVLMFGLLKSLISAALKPEKESPMPMPPGGGMGGMGGGMY